MSQRRLSALLGICLLAAVPAAPAQGPSAAEFDTVIGRLERGEDIIRSKDELKQALARLRALLPPDDPRRALRLRAYRCLTDDLGPAHNGLAFARAGLAEARRLGDVPAQVRFGYCESLYLDASGRSGEAAAPLEAALALARRHGDPHLIAEGLGIRGNARSLNGEQAAALVDLLEVERLYRQAELGEHAEATLLDIAIAYRRMGDHAKAADYLRQSTAFAERGRYWSLLVVSLLQTGFLHEDLGRYPQALEALQRALQVARQQDFEYDIGAAHLGIASVQVKQGDHAGAQRSLAAARTVFERVGDASNEAMLSLLEGQVLAARGQHAQALQRYAASERALQASDNLRYRAELHAARARSHEALGDWRAAAQDLRRQLELERRLDANQRDQQALLLRHQFDAARRDLENMRLQAERRSQAQKLEAAERVRRWQTVALITSAVLLLVLLALLLRQLYRMRRIRALAMTDELTGVANRRHIEQAALQAAAQARAEGRPLAVLTFDLDHFKRINDTYGHGAGDQVLVRVTRACEAALRQDDLLGRVGGEEFWVLLPGTSHEAALQVAERLREGVARLAFDDIAPGLRTTISLGLSALRADDASLDDAIDRADTALYRAKAAGRNRVEVEL